MHKLLGWLLLLCFVGSSCMGTRYLQDGETLLRKTKIVLEDAGQVPNANVISYELSTLVQQKPNTRFFFVPRQWFYFRSTRPQDTTRFDKWKAKALAEPPTIYDTSATEATVRALKSYMQYKSFFQASVREETRQKGKKSKVTYYVTPGISYSIDTVIYQSVDTAVERVMVENRTESPLKPGAPLDGKQLETEKNRIINLLGNKGYAGFYPRYIGQIDVDTTIRSGYGNVYIQVEPPYNAPAHPVYRVGAISVLMDYNAVNQGVHLDTVLRGIRFQSSATSFSVFPAVLLDAIHLTPGTLYRKIDIQETNDQLSELGVFSVVRIRETIDPADSTRINFQIELPRRPRYSLGADLNLSFANRYSSQLNNLLGITLNPQFKNKNLFGGAESYVGALSAGVELNMPGSGGANKGQLWNTIDLGLQNSVYLPKFVDYLGVWKLLYRFDPLERNKGSGLYADLRAHAATRLSLNYNYLLVRNFLTYNLFNASFGYDARPVSSVRYQLNHLGIDYLRPVAQDSFILFQSQNPFLQRSFGKQLFVSLLFKDFSLNRINNREASGITKWTNFNAELAGAEIWAGNALYNAFSVSLDPDTLTIGDVSFSQYLKSDFDWQYRKRLGGANEWASRLYAGIAVPFGYSEDIPYVKQFFAGGANGIRAWAPRGLGPGGFVDTLTLDNSRRRLFYQTGDIKLEFNLEYRFNILWVVNGAVFLDGGNIWTLRHDPSRCGSQFLFSSQTHEDCGGKTLDPFYKQIALGTGFGLRFDLTYFIFSFDVGVKLRQPAELPGNNGYWTNFTNIRKLNNVANFNLSLGYPFGF